MSTRQYDPRYYAELLYRLLPALYRERDATGELSQFLAVFGGELARLRANIDQLWRDLYVDSCQEWVLPYIGELVGTTVVFNDAARNRADIKKTVSWRRQKGTLVGLEDVAATISERGARATEMFERLIWSQNLNHLRPHALHTPDLADGTCLSRLRTPFDSSCRSVDLRTPGQHAGWHQIRNVNFYSWAISSYPVRMADPRAVDARRHRFHPLGLDLRLHAGGRDRSEGCDSVSTTADICFSHVDDVAIRGRDFHDDPTSYFGRSYGFTLYEDGIPLCQTSNAGPSRSTVPCSFISELAAEEGMLVADPGLFAGKDFQIEAVRLASQTVGTGPPQPVAYSPVAAFDRNFAVDGSQGQTETATFTYTKGAQFEPGAPDYHHAVLLLRIERLGAAADFPESELIVRNHRGRHLLVFLPELTGLASAVAHFLYVAEDGSTYHARGSHDAGPVDRNPDSGIFGAYLGRHLARGASGQVRPRPGTRPVTHRSAVYRDLCCWDQPLQKPLGPGELAFDPERGRLMFPAGEEPSGRLTVDFRFARTGELGAGPFDRGDLPSPTLTVSQTADADHRSIQDAIDAAPDGSINPVVIEILDSHTYDEALVIDNRDFSSGLTIQAQRLETPVLSTALGTALQVTATAQIGKLSLDGLMISGAIDVQGDVSLLSLRFCSLHPAAGGIDYAPGQPQARLECSNCVCGAVSASANVESLLITDSVLQHPQATLEHPESHAALSATGAARLEQVTVLGALSVDSLGASNSILYGPLHLTDAASSCLRYSRHPRLTSAVPTFRTTTDFPIFVSIQPGDPGHMHLHPNSSDALRRGGEEGGEMGAFYRAGLPWREQNVAIKLAEYLPAGLRPVAVRVFPLSRFSGVRRI